MESETFSKVEEFLESWEQNDNDLVIPDMHMPGLGGCNLLNFLREKNLHPYVIIVTAYDEKDSRECSQKYGVMAYFTKPVDSELLIDVIKSKCGYPFKTKSV